MWPHSSQALHSFFYFKDVVNNIISVRHTAENNKSLRCYLDGKRVDDAYNGMVIENGKKVLVK